MAVLGYLLLAFGLLVYVYGEVRFLVVAYRLSLWWFFGCLFVPLVSEVFLVLHLRAAIKPFAIALLGFLLVILSCWISGNLSPG